MTKNNIPVEIGIKSILIPVDFSPASINALRYVARVFGNVDQVTLIHVLDDLGVDIDQIMDSLVKLARLELGQIPAGYKITTGAPIAEIVNSALDMAPDLLVMGVKEGSDWSQSIAENLLKNLDIPVIAIPQGYISYQLETLAFASDYKEVRCAEGFDLIRKLAQAFNTKVYLFHIQQDGDPKEDFSETSIEYYLESVEHDYVMAEDDHILETLQTFMENKQLDLISVLARDHGANPLPSEGRLIYELVRASTIPVLILT